MNTAIAFAAPSVKKSTLALWAARILAGLAVLFLAFDTTLHILRLAPALEGAVQLGYPPGVVVWLGVIQLVCLGLYLVPRTAPIGAVLWTGYLGGAIATHVRLENPLVSHTLFPVYVAVLLWLPLYLRDERVRRLVTSAE